MFYTVYTVLGIYTACINSRYIINSLAIIACDEFIYDKTRIFSIIAYIVIILLLISDTIHYCCIVTRKYNLSIITPLHCSFTHIYIYTVPTRRYIEYIVML